MRKTKKLLSMLLAVAMICSCLTVGAFAAEQNYLLGDVNADGKVSASDARATLRCSVYLEEFTDKQIELADITANGIIEAADARLILRHSVGFSDPEWGPDNAVDKDDDKVESDDVYTLSINNSSAIVGEVTEFIFSVNSTLSVPYFELYMDSVSTGIYLYDDGDYSESGDDIPNDGCYTA